MAAHKVSPLHILLPVAALFAVYITSATAEGLDVNSLPKEVVKSKTVDQANRPAGAPMKGDPTATTIPNEPSSAPAPGRGVANGAAASSPGGGADTLNQIMKPGSLSGVAEGPHSHESSGSPAHGPPSFLSVAMVMGFISFFFLALLRKQEK